MQTKIKIGFKHSEVYPEVCVLRHFVYVQLVTLLKNYINTSSELLR